MRQVSNARGCRGRGSGPASARPEPAQRLSGEGKSGSISVGHAYIPLALQLRDRRGDRSGEPLHGPRAITVNGLPVHPGRACNPRAPRAQAPEIVGTTVASQLNPMCHSGLSTQGQHAAIATSSYAT
jgi:hypothetical protein